MVTGGGLALSQPLQNEDAKSVQGVCSCEWLGCDKETFTTTNTL